MAVNIWLAHCSVAMRNKVEGMDSSFRERCASLRQHHPIHAHLIAFSKLKIALISIIVIMGCFVSSCKGIDISETLEFDNVWPFKMERDSMTQVPNSISGLCGKSMYSVSGVTSKKNGNVLIILVKIHVARNGESGSFGLPIMVTDDIDEIRFGEKQYLLWKRYKVR